MVHSTFSILCASWKPTGASETKLQGPTILTEQAAQNFTRPIKLACFPITSVPIKPTHCPHCHYWLASQKNKTIRSFLFFVLKRSQAQVLLRIALMRKAALCSLVPVPTWETKSGGMCWQRWCRSVGLMGISPMDKETCPFASQRMPVRLRVPRTILSWTRRWSCYAQPQLMWVVEQRRVSSKTSLPSPLLCCLACELETVLINFINACDMTASLYQSLFPKWVTRTLIWNSLILSWNQISNCLYDLRMFESAWVAVPGLLVVSC